MVDKVINKKDKYIYSIYTHHFTIHSHTLHFTLLHPPHTSHSPHTTTPNHSTLPSGTTQLPLPPSLPPLPYPHMLSSPSQHPSSPNIYIYIFSYIYIYYTYVFLYICMCSCILKNVYMHVRVIFVYLIHI